MGKQLNLASSYPLSLSEKAFTLMELLIAITIGAMVMAIIATAFHVSVANWERVRKSNDRLQVFQIADLLANQLLHLRKRPIPARGRNRTAFYGKERELLFVTDYSLLGLFRNNSVIVSARFDDNEKILVYRQMLLNPRGDFQDFIGNFLEGRITAEMERWIEERKIPMEKVVFEYRKDDETSFRKTWTGETGELPDVVRLSFDHKGARASVVRVVNLKVMEKIGRLYVKGKNSE